MQLEIGKARTVLTAADAVFIASGTATLEAMLAKTAMVVGYKMNWLTHQIAKRLVKLKFFSLPNLLADKALVTELLQEQVTVRTFSQSYGTFITRSKSAASMRGLFYRAASTDPL